MLNSIGGKIECGVHIAANQYGLYAKSAKLFSSKPQKYVSKWFCVVELGLCVYAETLQVCEFLLIDLCKFVDSST